MTVFPYRPSQPVSGPSYGSGFRRSATLVSLGLAAYGLSVALRFPLWQFGLGVQLFLLGAALMLGVSYYWFLRARTTIDAGGITQTWLYDKRLAWSEVRGAKMIGVPHASWIFPPRLVLRTGNAFVTFNGGSPALLTEFARIVQAYRLRP